MLFGLILGTIKLCMRAKAEALTSLQRVIDYINPSADLEHIYIKREPNKSYRTVHLQELPAHILQGIADRIGAELAGKTDQPNIFFIGLPKLARPVEGAETYAVVFQSPEAALELGINPTTGRAIPED